MTEIRATVRFVDPNGRKGPYARADSEQVEGGITFSLDENVWQGSTIPQNGAHVILSNLFRTDKGWRASSARLLTPADEAAEFQKT